MSTNQSLSRGLRLLDAINASSEHLGIREVARLLDISPSIAQRLVNTLVEAGYLQQVVETRKYRLGVSALALGSKMVRSDELYASASSELRILAEQHQLNGFLGVLQQEAVVYLHTVQSHGAIAIRAAAGERVSPHATALGKALLAELPSDRLEEILGAAPYAARTKHTLTAARTFAKELELTRRVGYSIADEENELGVVSIGTPIRNHDGMVVAAISVAFLKAQRGPKEWPEIADLVVRAGLRCSAALGFTPPSHGHVAIQPVPTPARRTNTTH
ncbi:IclR family transcriptional regulator [Hydrogenophaga sp. BPS33]|uniref:IclR family transcriptional regulator n=1 Tax=Hydrogenophaga sp. BPS33 TaxID=2651974 RepID=UPI00131FD2FB|nr:IclR family transcriptional regulator [Hydrogenophaga sp. BPS33]QHE88600.1 IclR family transcriptional regulator [Hydrogenophaga sp. BPS33]